VGLNVILELDAESDISGLATAEELFPDLSGK
jgi:hypothetical protein